jgi:soluble calcium-activated nucleotidase 1
VEGNRGMELSGLQFWNDKLYTFCDRTGIVYELDGSRAMARFILPEGDAKTSQKGFKSEWATVKDGNLVVGSIGKEWTDGKGNVLNHAPMFIKIIEPNGKIHHVDWTVQYNLLREKTGTIYPGYLVHEAVTWSNFHKKWFFLPRRVSKEKYDEKIELKKGSNTIITADENFKNFEVKRIGTKTPIRGFSSVKFIPGRPNELIALKSEEEHEKQRAYVTVFNLDGEVLLEETLIGEEKYEGLEIR